MTITMELKITRQNNEANEISINMDMIINNIEYHLIGYVNFEEYEEHIEVSTFPTKYNNDYQDLYNFCEEQGYDYNEIKDYIMNHTNNKITN